MVCFTHQVIVNLLLRNAEICNYMNKRHIKRTIKQCARTISMFVLAILKAEHLCIIFYKDIVQKRELCIGIFRNGQMQTTNLTISKQKKNTQYL